MIWVLLQLVLSRFINSPNHKHKMDKKEQKNNKSGKTISRHILPGIDVLNNVMPKDNSSQTISMRTCVESKEFQESKYHLPVILGEDINRKTQIIDLVKVPCILISGMSNKEINNMLNVLISSLVIKKNPEQLKLILIDASKIELLPYNKLIHKFFGSIPKTQKAIISGYKDAIKTLENLNNKIDYRAELLEKANVRSIDEYNKKLISNQLDKNNKHKHLPYLVVIINEYSFYKSKLPKELEIEISRAALNAKKLGVHLIITTQNPGIEIITGMIKFSFPGRIAFQVKDKIDSRTVIDIASAEKLTGNGDMLFLNGESENEELLSLQTPHISKPELLEMLNFIEKQADD